MKMLHISTEKKSCWCYYNFFFASWVKVTPDDADADSAVVCCRDISSIICVSRSLAPPHIWFASFFVLLVLSLMQWRCWGEIKENTQLNFWIFPPKHNPQRAHHTGVKLTWSLENSKFDRFAISIYTFCFINFHTQCRSTFMIRVVRFRCFFCGSLSLSRKLQ